MSPARRLPAAVITGLALACMTLGSAPAAPMSAARQVTHGNISDPSMSPDGRRMVVIRVVAGVEQLEIMDVDGGHETALPQTSFDREDPAWSPDGRHIAYVSKEGGGERIHIMNPDGGQDTALTPPTQRTIHPSWARDSRSLLYCSDDDLHPPLKNTAEIYSIDLRTRTPRVVIAGGVNTFPNYSPDGHAIAFRRMVGETNSEVFMARADGSGARNITNDPAFDGWPAWSPDGRTLAFASNRDGNHKIYVMKPDGSDVRLLADTEGRGTAPKWSIDGAQVYFSVCKRIDGGFDCEIYAAAFTSANG